MQRNVTSYYPPHCPNKDCRFHKHDRELWKFVRYGTFSRQLYPHVIQRWKCDACRRTFSTQTFKASYWMRLPKLLEPTFQFLVSCAGYRQIARALGISPQTAARIAARLGRQALLLHEQLRPKGPLKEPLALDSFESFEYSQYYPTSFHVAVGQKSHYFYGFTESELRRKGRMTKGQRAKRAKLEEQLGRPDPRSIEKEVLALLMIVAAESKEITLHTDEHQDYPRAVRKLTGVRVEHRTISSRAARTQLNPLFPVNLLDLLIRHSGGNHKRETIGFSKRRQGAISRLWVFLAWRNYGKSFSERDQGESAAMKAGVVDRIWKVREIIGSRRFPFRIGLPERWQTHYAGETPTRCFPRVATHRLKYAY